MFKAIQSSGPYVRPCYLPSNILGRNVTNRIQYFALFSSVSRPHRSPYFKYDSMRSISSCTRIIKTTSKVSRLGPSILLIGSFAATFSAAVYHRTVCAQEVVPITEKTQKNFEDITAPILENIQKLVVARRQDPTLSPIILGIAGPSSVGKSYFSQMLVDLLKGKQMHAVIFELDRFLEYIPPEGALPYHPNFDHLNAHRAISEIMLGAKHIVVPMWVKRNGLEYTKSREVFDLQGADLVIIEGEFTLCGPETYDFLKYTSPSLRVVLDVPDPNIIFEWNWSRGRGIEGMTKEQYREKVIPSLKKFNVLMVQMRNNADFVITQNRQHLYSLEKP